MSDQSETHSIPLESPTEPGRLNPALYIDRELSWLAFNERVLEEAEDAAHPLLERVKFAAIFHSNLDEFFMIRVSGVKEQIAANVQRTTASGLTLPQLYQEISSRVLSLVSRCQRLVCDELLPALRSEGIIVAQYAELSPAQQEAMAEYFDLELFPVLTPLVVDPSHPFPFVSNLSLNLGVEMEGRIPSQRFARVKVPETLPRLIRVPTSDPGAPVVYVWIEEIMAANIGRLFPGTAIKAVYIFRITRDVDLEIQEDETVDILQTMEENVRQRRFGAVVRLELEAHANDQIRGSLAQYLGLQEAELYLSSGPLGLSSLMQLLEINRPDLKDPPFDPAKAAFLGRNQEIFAAIRAGDILLHHPFDTFSTVVELIEAAAHDPQVLAIKQTLYRAGRNSPIVRALMRARENGKQVAVLVELKARFDEESNIGWAKALESTGAHVVYGMHKLKVHGKLLLIVRKEADGIRRYVHLATGNYNASTARLYTDFGLLTCNPEIGADVSELFNVLTGASEQKSYRKLLVAPHSLHQALLEKTEREIERHRREGNGRIIFKCNGLTDEAQILSLYRAAQAGVKIDLIIRGVCAIRPGIAGISENLRVRSIVGRFLEHHRLYYFYNGGDEELFLGSADLMERNLHHRVEQLVLVEDDKLKRHLRDTVLELYLRDNTQARELQSDGNYQRVKAHGAEAINAQDELLRLSGQTAAD